MKKFLTVVFTMLLAGSLAFAQTGGGSTDKAADTGKKPVKTAAHKGGKKGHKGGKKSKKGSSTGASTTTPPK